MSKTTYLVTTPDGVTHKRTTDRTYTHCVVGRPSYQAALASADCISEYDKKNFAYFVECITLGAAHPNASCWTAEGLAERQRVVDLHKTADNYAEAMRVNNVARVEAQKAAGYYDTFGALTWCGRPDLAQKQIAKHADMLDVHAIAVTVKA